MKKLKYYIAVLLFLNVVFTSCQSSRSGCYGGSCPTFSKLEKQESKIDLVTCESLIDHCNS